MTSLIVKSSHVLAGIYFIFPKSRPRKNLKGFRYQIWTSLKRLGNKLSSKTNLNAFHQISSSNFRLKLCQRLKSYKHCQNNQIWGGLGRVRKKKLFSYEIAHYKKRSVSAFQEIITSNDKIFISGGGMSNRQ